MTFNFFFNGINWIKEKVTGIVTSLKYIVANEQNSDSKESHFAPLFFLMLSVLALTFSFEWYTAHAEWKEYCHPKPSESSAQPSQPNRIPVNCGNGQQVDVLISCDNPQKQSIQIKCDDQFGYVLQKIVYFTTQTSVILMFCVFGWFSRLAYKRYQGKRTEIMKNTSSKEKQTKELQDLRGKETSHFLRETLVGSLSISAIPTGISLIICAFYDMTFIKHMSGVEIYIAFAGISILSIGFISALQEQAQISEHFEIVHLEDIKPGNPNPVNFPSKE